MIVTSAEATSEATAVAAVRSFIRGRRHRRWYDWYAIAFAVVLAVILMSDLLAEPFSRLTASAAHSAPAQAEAGAGLVIAAAAWLLMLAQAFGPLALSPADASWLLLSPLDRRDVLRQPTAATAAVSALAGGALGVLALAMAGPYLRYRGHRVPWDWLVLAVTGGAGFFLALVLTAVLVQPRQQLRGRLRITCAVVSACAVLGGVAGERWTSLSRAVTARFAEISTAAIGVLAAVALAAASGAALLVWRMLARFPAEVAHADSARAGLTRLAASFGNLSLLTWITEDNRWRGRTLTSRPWPRVPPAFALAWPDWRRLGRHPAALTVLATSALAPALAGAAITGHGRGLTIAGTLLAGALAAGTQGTAATRRDSYDPALRRLLGVDTGAALAARAVLPALLCAAWMTLALALLVLTGVLSGWLWPPLGLAAGPGLAAAALRMARAGLIDPAEQGPDTPLGSVPPWLISRALSVVVGVAGCYPALRAISAGRVHGSTLAAQVAVSGVVLGGYLVLAGAGRQAARRR
ncbi:MAG: hypothetical protein JO345_39280 [Streptosporangiaceae bacterium]|nr:hypothetical protein [Streptosporangiaceae bacterium]